MILDYTHQRLLKPGDVVKYICNAWSSSHFGRVGIVLAPFNDGFDAIVLMPSGKRFVDRQQYFVKL